MGYTDSFGFQWTAHARTQLDSHSGKPISRDRLFGVTGWPARMDGQRILEAGSGAGRFTEVLLTTGAEVWSFDDSDAVDANRANNGRAPNLRLFRSDIYGVTFHERFDKILCLGVLQHTPDPRRAFLRLAQYLKPGGEIVVDVYEKRLTALLSWKYLLRPITRRMDRRRLYAIVAAIVPVLLPVAITLRKVMGRFGARLVPVKEYSDLGLDLATHIQWSILDTFDNLSPAYDKPQSIATVREWFAAAGLRDARVWRGPNGLIGKGRA